MTDQIANGTSAQESQAKPAATNYIITQLRNYDIFFTLLAIFAAKENISIFKFI